MRVQDVLELLYNTLDGEELRIPFDRVGGYTDSKAKKVQDDVYLMWDGDTGEFTFLAGLEIGFLGVEACQPV